MQWNCCIDFFYVLPEIYDGNLRQETQEVITVSSEQVEDTSFFSYDLEKRLIFLSLEQYIDTNIEPAGVFKFTSQLTDELGWYTTEYSWEIEIIGTSAQIYEGNSEVDVKAKAASFSN